jgi:hypothetical protein
MGVATALNICRHPYIQHDRVAELLLTGVARIDGLERSRGLLPHRRVLEASLTEDMFCGLEVEFLVHPCSCIF